MSIPPKTLSNVEHTTRSGRGRHPHVRNSSKEDILMNMLLIIFGVIITAIGATAVYQVALPALSGVSYSSRTIHDYDMEV